MRHDIIEYAEVSPVIGRTVTVTVDRPLGSYHPEHKDMYYPINYGYVEGIMAPDGEEQDAYILGVDEAIEKFTGKISHCLLLCLYIHVINYPLYNPVLS
jgi:inorganic pyrophosphatase